MTMTIACPGDKIIRLRNMCMKAIANKQVTVPLSLSFLWFTFQDGLGWTGMIMMSPTVTVETVSLILMRTVQIMRRRIISVEIIMRINRVSLKTLT